MSFKDKSIRIDDWSGNLLYIGPYDDDEAVNKVLDANRCNQCENYADGMCAYCDDTGYIGDFEVSWVDEENNRYNVYEYINY